MTSELRDKAYHGPAKKWIAQVLAIGFGTGIFNMVVVTGGGVGGILVAFLVNFAASIAAAFLLFRHVDTLILQRIAEIERQ